MITPRTAICTIGDMAVADNAAALTTLRTHDGTTAITSGKTETSIIVNTMITVANGDDAGCRQATVKAAIIGNIFSWTSDRQKKGRVLIREMRINHIYPFSHGAGFRYNFHDDA